MCSVCSLLKATVHYLTLPLHPLHQSASDSSVHSAADASKILTHYGDAYVGC